ncbi:MAG: hypothetical protein ABWZ52_01675 [Acidimicrobiales bacterium]
MSLAWIDDGEMPPDEELRRRYSPVANLTLARVAFEAQIPLLQGAVVIDVEEEGPRSTAILQTVAKGRMRLSTVVDEEGRIKGVGACQDPEGVEIRAASAADGPRLAELCRTVPIETPGRRTWLDYGDDYLAATALCEAREVLIAELDGAVVGLQGLAYHQALVAGTRREVFYLRHTRVAPAAKGTGVFSALNGRVFERTACAPTWRTRSLPSATTRSGDAFRPPFANGPPIGGSISPAAPCRDRPLRTSTLPRTTTPSTH